MSNVLVVGLGLGLPHLTALRELTGTHCCVPGKFPLTTQGSVPICHPADRFLPSALARLTTLTKLELDSCLLLDACLLDLRKLKCLKVCVRSLCPFLVIVWMFPIAHILYELLLYDICSNMRSKSGPFLLDQGMST